VVSTVNREKSPKLKGAESEMSLPSIALVSAKPWSVPYLVHAALPLPTKCKSMATSTLAAFWIAKATSSGFARPQTQVDHREQWRPDFNTLPRQKIKPLVLILNMQNYDLKLLRKMHG